MGAFRSDGHALVLNVTGELTLRNRGATQSACEWCDFKAFFK